MGMGVDRLRTIIQAQNKADLSKYIKRGHWDEYSDLVFGGAAAKRLIIKRVTIPLSSFSTTGKEAITSLPGY